MRIAVIVHVFYPDLWRELAACIRNIGEPKDVYVTFVDEAAVVCARADFPKAKFIRCENRGYDIWPFLQVLQCIDLSAYDIVVKLHTKRDIRYDLVMNHAWFSGSRWRKYLLGFVRTRRAWRRTLSALNRPDVGIAADRHVIFDGEIAGPEFRPTVERAMAEAEALAGMRPREDLFVAGTMFAARASALAPLLRRRHAADDFEPYGGHDRETHAHVMERVFGFCASAAGFRVVAFSGSVDFWRWYYRQSPVAKMLRFFYQVRSRNWKYTIKVCGIPVYVRRLTKPDAGPASP